MYKLKLEFKPTGLALRTPEFELIIKDPWTISMQKLRFQGNSMYFIISWAGTLELC